MHAYYHAPNTLTSLSFCLLLLLSHTAFLFERLYQKKQGVKLGPCVLYMGVRYKKKDFVLQDEWNMFIKEGVLNKLQVAFSRDADGGKTMHVQHLMHMTPADVWEVVKQ